MPVLIHTIVGRQTMSSFDRLPKRIGWSSTTEPIVVLVVLIATLLLAVCVGGSATSGNPGTHLPDPRPGLAPVAPGTHHIVPSQRRSTPLPQPSASTQNRVP